MKTKLIHTLYINLYFVVVPLPNSSLQLHTVQCTALHAQYGFLCSYIQKFSWTYFSLCPFYLAKFTVSGVIFELVKGVKGVFNRSTVCVSGNGVVTISRVNLITPVLFSYLRLLWMILNANLCNRTRLSAGTIATGNCVLLGPNVLQAGYCTTGLLFGYILWSPKILISENRWRNNDIIKMFSVFLSSLLTLMAVNTILKETTCLPSYS